MIRLVDVIFSVIGLAATSPVWFLALLLVWLEDKRNPIYIAWRVGFNCELFKMYKIRTMIVDADKSKVDTTAKDDPRLTFIGKFIRKYKIDELLQLFNVLNGTMSFVGPRPNVKREVDIYTNEELKLLSVRPGVTDFSSIVFSDLAEIMANEKDPNIAYNQLVRPWKSRLGLFYVDNMSLLLNIKLITFTILSIFDRAKVLIKISLLLKRLNADPILTEFVKREKELKPYPPPGINEIVTSRVLK